MNDCTDLFNHCIDNEFSRSIKYADVNEIDEKAITTCIKESAAINETGYKREVKDKTFELPQDLISALKKNRAAHNFFEALTYGYKKEYN